VISWFVSPATIPDANDITHTVLASTASAAYAAAFLSLFGRIMANLHELGVLPAATQWFARKPSE